MRFAIIAAALLGSVSAAPAETAASAVRMIKEICVDPDSANLKLSAAERFGLEQQWTFVEAASGRRPFEWKGRSSPDTAMTVVNKVWEIGEGALKGSTLIVSVLAPEIQNAKWDLCGLVVPRLDQTVEDVARAIESEFSDRIEKLRPAPDRIAEHEYLFLVPNKSPDSYCKTVSVADWAKRNSNVAAIMITEIENPNKILPGYYDRSKCWKS